MKKFAIFFALVISTFSYANMLDTSIPKCDQVGDTIEGMLNDRTKETGIDFTLKDVFVVREVKEKNQNKDIRLCYALLQTETYNKLEILYSIWVEGRQFFVEITDANPIIDTETLSKTQENLQNQMAESKLQEFEMAKKYGDMKEACMSLRVAKNFFLNAKNEEQYKRISELLKKENCK
jgi:hypothetical protein|nr:MAG TPA: hypothetical protein [Caudoviricetes sp.]